MSKLLINYHFASFFFLHFGNVNTTTLICYCFGITLYQRNAAANQASRVVPHKLPVIEITLWFQVKSSTCRLIPLKKSHLCKERVNASS